MSFFVLILPLGGGRTEGSSICLQILAEGSRLRETAIPEGHRPAALLSCLRAVGEPKVRQFACKFLPRDPACGKRQSPKGTDRRHFYFAFGRWENRRFVNLLANSCRGFPLAGNGNPRRTPTGGTFILPSSGGKTKGSSICLQILAEGPRLRDTAIPEAHRPAAL